MDVPNKISLSELANALGIAVQTHIIKIEQASFIFKKYLRDIGLLHEVKPNPIINSVPKKKVE